MNVYFYITCFHSVIEKDVSEWHLTVYNRPRLKRRDAACFFSHKQWLPISDVREKRMRHVSSTIFGLTLNNPCIHSHFFNCKQKYNDHVCRLFYHFLIKDAQSVNSPSRRLSVMFAIHNRRYCIDYTV